MPEVFDQIPPSPSHTDQTLRSYIKSRIEDLRREYGHWTMVEDPTFRSIQSADKGVVQNIIHLWYGGIAGSLFAQQKVEAGTLEQHEMNLFSHILQHAEHPIEHKKDHYFVCEAVCENEQTNEAELRVIGVMGYTQDIDQEIVDTLQKRNLPLEEKLTENGIEHVAVCELRSLYFDPCVSHSGFPVGEALFWYTVKKAYDAGYRRATLIKGDKWSEAEQKIYGLAPGFTNVGDIERSNGINGTVYTADLDVYMEARNEKKAYFEQLLKDYIHLQP